MPPRRKRATLKDIAEMTGLSTAAVSYALRGLQVSEETRERVRKAAAELGYEADPIARALASGRTGMIGVLCGSLEDLWQQRISAAIGRTVLRIDQYALIIDAAGDPDRQRTLALQLRDQRVDGIIVSPLDPAAEVWAELAQSVPLVSIGDALNRTRSAGEVVFDNRRGVTIALEHLHELGHRRIAVLTPTLPSTQDRPAEVHVSAEAQRLKLDVTVLSSPHALPDAAEVARLALSSEQRPTALFCFSDSIAYGAYAAARDLRLKIPRDLSIAGYDDQPVSALLTPALTSFDWDIDKLVTSAVEIVTRSIERDGAGRKRRITISPNFRPRASTAAPR